VSLLPARADIDVISLIRYCVNKFAAAALTSRVASRLTCNKWREFIAYDLNVQTLLV